MTFTLAQLAPHLGSIFVVHTHAGMIKLQMVDVRELPRRSLPEGFRTPLSLLFSGPETPQLVQDNYTFDHPALGRQVWTTTPVHIAATAPATGMLLRYEVLFS
ncbi:MAG: hypothetical protein AB7I35_16805 [Ramlibacter sp.]|nr:hypothetical protein [Ramlibacter sp.]